MGADQLRLEDRDETSTTGNDDPTDPYLRRGEATGKPFRRPVAAPARWAHSTARSGPCPARTAGHLLTAPARHDGTTPLPLVLDFHGLSEGARSTGCSASRPTAAKRGFVLVSTASGTGRRWPGRSAPDRKGNPDIVYTDQVLDQLEADLCIDTSRVYATGLSNGAFMSSVLACVMADRIAIAVAG